MTTYKHYGLGRRIGYWITTGLLVLIELWGGIAQLGHAKWMVDGMTHLGYPLYFMTILGSWKILGVMALLVPRYPLVKEWAYAGFFIAMSGAVISHLFCNDPFGETMWSFGCVVLTVLSWYWRPAGRRLAWEGF